MSFSKNTKSLTSHAARVISLLLAGIMLAALLCTLCPSRALAASAGAGEENAAEGEAAGDAGGDRAESAGGEAVQGVRIPRVVVIGIVIAAVVVGGVAGFLFARRKK